MKNLETPEKLSRLEWCILKKLSGITLDQNFLQKKEVMCLNFSDDKENGLIFW